MYMKFYFYPYLVITPCLLNSNAVPFVYSNWRQIESIITISIDSISEMHVSFPVQKDGRDSVSNFSIIDLFIQKETKIYNLQFLCSSYLIFPRFSQTRFLKVASAAGKKLSPANTFTSWNVLGSLFSTLYICLPSTETE